MSGILPAASGRTESNSINQLMKCRAQSSHARDFLFGTDWPHMRLRLSVDIYLDGFIDIDYSTPLTVCKYLKIQFDILIW